MVLRPDGCGLKLDASGGGLKRKRKMNRIINLTLCKTRTDPFMVSITNGANYSSFTYDGLGRRVADAEVQSGVATDAKFVWDGQTLAEQRDSTGTNITKRFFSEGEQISGTNYYFTRDHLGSVREMTDSSGTIQARYSYDPYGRMTQISGGLSADFGYAGMYYHAPSGLNLTLYRAYDSDLGRWLSRDPLAEGAGLNLYAYVANNPINLFDPYGMFAWGQFFTGIAEVAGGIAGVAAATGGEVASGGLSTALSGYVAVNSVVVGSHGIADIIASFSNDTQFQQGIQNQPSNIASIIGNAVDGQNGQEIGNNIDLGLNISSDLNDVMNPETVNSTTEGGLSLINDILSKMKDLMDSSENGNGPCPGNGSGNGQNDEWNFINQLSMAEWAY
jgi:RHS repeat-associated protein